MTTLWIIAVSLFLIGIAGVCVNSKNDLPFYEIKYHLYSTIPTIIGLLLLLISIFSLK